MSDKDALSKLRECLEKFKEEAAKTGWEEDEVDEKLAEVIENFPWYSFSQNVKKSWKARIWSFCLYSFIIYLAIGALLQRNRRMKKNINDYIFDLQLPYYQNRILRYLTLPIFKFYDLSKYHGSECLLHNPFLQTEPKCEFCENITWIPSEPSNDVDIMEMVTGNQIFTLHDLPGYHNNTNGFIEVQNLFLNHGKSMDESICKIHSEQFSRVSDYFKLTKEELKAKNLSIGWRNCDAYGTRFYRKLFTRPSFISNMSEILLEKEMYFLQPGVVISLGKIGGETIYIFQVQGKSEYSFQAPEGCHLDCISVPIKVILHPGQIVVFPNAEWITSVKSLGEEATLLYLSTFDS